MVFNKNHSKLQTFASDLYFLGCLIVSDFEEGRGEQRKKNCWWAGGRMLQQQTQACLHAGSCLWAVACRTACRPSWRMAWWMLSTEDTLLIWRNCSSIYTTGSQLLYPEEFQCFTELVLSCITYVATKQTCLRAQPNVVTIAKCIPDVPVLPWLLRTFTAENTVG